ncbi:hypothetical protein TB1_003585 [Malus domestica]
MSWNSMISAYVQSGQNREALELFWNLLNEPLPLEPDAKCGYLETAQEVFDRMIFRDVSSWNTMRDNGLCNTWVWENIHRVFLQNERQWHST